MRLAQTSFLLLLGLAASERRSTHGSLALDAAGAGGAAAAEARAAGGRGASLADQVREGSLFLGRFRMKQALWARGLERGGRGELLPLPPAVAGRFASARPISSGSFGETWSAYDLEQRRPVALKMFYRTAGGGAREHLTWRLAAGDEELRGSLRHAAGECLVAQRVQRYAARDPEGASRLMQCYEDHVTCAECLAGGASGRSTTDHVVTREQPLYQVLEDCSGEGGLELQKWAEQVVGAPGYLDRALALFKQMVQGLAYLSEHEVKWVHHDLKPENVVVKRMGGAEYAKIIDFGSMSEATEAVATGPAIVATPTHAAVEYFYRGKKRPIVQFDFASPWSFDMYSAGCILVKMITGYSVFSSFATLVPDGLLADFLQKHECEEGDEECRSTALMFALKKKVEPKITQFWGRDKAVVASAQAMLFDEVEDAFVETSRAFVAGAQQHGSFMEQVVAMLSSVPKDRPTPRQVLEAPFMSARRTAPDPGFDKVAAQARAAKADAVRAA